MRLVTLSIALILLQSFFSFLFAAQPRDFRWTFGHTGYNYLVLMDGNNDNIFDWYLWVSEGVQREYYFVHHVNDSATNPFVNLEAENKFWEIGEAKIARCGDQKKILAANVYTVDGDYAGSFVMGCNDSLLFTQEPVAVFQKKIANEPEIKYLTYTNEIQIVFPFNQEGVTLQILDINGRTCIEKRILNEEFYNLNPEMLVTGVYIAKLIYRDSTYSGIFAVTN